MGSTWLNGGFHKFTDPPASPTRKTEKKQPMLEAYREFSKSGVILQYRELLICYGTQDPLRFYELIDSRSQKQAEPPKLRLATPYLDIIYQEQERLKAIGLEQGYNVDEEDFKTVNKEENVKQVCAAESTFVAESTHAAIATSGETEVIDAAKSSDEAKVADAAKATDADKVIIHVENVAYDEKNEMKAARKRKSTTSPARCSNKQVKPAPSFEMLDDRTIVVRHGGKENFLPYKPNMVRKMGLGPRSPWEQARRDRLNAACRMSRARAKEGATRRYTFRKETKKPPKEDESHVIDIEKQGEL